MHSNIHKSLLLAAALGATAVPAQAQSSNLTLSGKLDLGIGKNIGATSSEMLDGAGSRLAFRGQEDLGGGWHAAFGLEHRFSPDTGQPANPNIFWQGYSTLGIGHAAWGTVNLGRQYTAAYSTVQNVIDPWGGDTVAQLRTAWRGGISKTRVSDSVRYDLRRKDLHIAVSSAEAQQEASNAGPRRPFSVGANTHVGPVLLAIGWEDPAHADDHLLSLGAAYKVGQARLAFGLARGVTTRNDDFKSMLLGVTYGVGVGEIKAGFVTAKTRKPDGSLRSEARKFGIGYFHHLSRRTFLYTNVARDSKAATEKLGYDVGLQHNF